MGAPGGAGASAEADARRDVVTDWLEQLDPGSTSWETELDAVTMTLVDALLEADVATLEALDNPLRDKLAALFGDEGAAREMRGYLLGVLAAAQWAVRRLPDPAEDQIGRDTQARRMLEELARDARLTSAELQKRLRTDKSQLSRVGRRLLASNLVVQRRAGREAIWELGPRGKQLLRRSEEQRDRTTR